MPEMLNEKLCQDSDFPHGMLPRWPNDIETARGNRKFRHDGNERASRIRVKQRVRQFCDAEPCNSRGCQSQRVIRLEPALRADGNDFATLHQAPRFGTLQQSLVDREIVGCFRSPMNADVLRARDELGVDRRDPAGHEVGITKVSNSNRAVKTLCRDVDEAVAIGGLDVQTRVPAREVCEHGRKVRRAQGKRCRNAQATAQLSCRQDRFQRDFHLTADAARMLPEGQTGLRQADPSCCTRKELDSQPFFESEDLATDNGFGDAESPCCRRQAAGVGDLDEGSEVFELQLWIPRSSPGSRMANMLSYRNAK